MKPKPEFSESSLAYQETLQTLQALPPSIWLEGAAIAKAELEEAGGSCFVADLVENSRDVKETVIALFDLVYYQQPTVFTDSFAPTIKYLYQCFLYFIEADESDLIEYFSDQIRKPVSQLFKDLTIENIAELYFREQIINERIFDTGNPQNKTTLIAIFNRINKSGVAPMFEQHEFLMKAFANQFVRWLTKQRNANQQDLASPLKVNVTKKREVEVLIPCNGFYSQLFSAQGYSNNRRRAERKMRRRKSGTEEVDFFIALETFSRNAILNLPPTFVNSFVDQVKAEFLELHETGKLPAMLGPLEQN